MIPEAREMAKVSYNSPVRDAKIEKIIDKIEKRAQQGYYDVTLYVSGVLNCDVEKEDIEFIKGKLTECGYRFELKHDPYTSIKDFFAKTFGKKYRYEFIIVSWQHEKYRIHEDC